MLALDLVSHHIVPHTVCSSVIEGRIQTTNILRDAIRFHKDAETGNIYVNGAEMLTRDVMAKNGVIHFISKVLIPVAGEHQQDNILNKLGIVL